MPIRIPRTESASETRPNCRFSGQRLAYRYYKTEKKIIYACADVLREECKAIIDAGLILQIDDPSIAENFDQIVPEPSIEDYQAFTQIRVDALKGLPSDRIRFHLCWGSWHGPHTTDVKFRHIVDLMLQINADAYTFEAANARHEHEWKIWEDVNTPGWQDHPARRRRACHERGRASGTGCRSH